MARVSFRKDGFVGQHAQDEGEYTTIPIQVPQGVHGIRINAATATGGQVHCAVLTGDGQEISGMTLRDSAVISGDYCDAELSWQGGKTLSALQGSEIKLQFAARAATIFSFELI
ncbi:hypothetical protein SDC9_186639 [bioreactor metagenome]|uniref:Uncharacterized protein n=1 Tax=bioreactor metagenome TaxID=1076179 RepID=A0A645HL20_9ZZZZ